LELVDNLTNNSAPVEIISYLLLVSLCGNFQDLDPQHLRYPPDVLLNILRWLKQKGINAKKIIDFKEFDKLINNYFLENHGDDLKGIIKQAEKANENQCEAFEKLVARFEEKTNGKLPEAHSVINGFKQFCKVQAHFSKMIFAEPEWYCSMDYIGEEKKLPEPVFFLESKTGIPIDKELEKLYYIQTETHVSLKEFPSEYQTKYRHLTNNENIIRAAHFLSPKYTWETPHKIEPRLWQQNYNIISPLKFLTDGPDRLSEYAVKDIMSLFSLVGTKVFDTRGEIIPPNMPPKRLADPRLDGYFHQIRASK